MDKEIALKIVVDKLLGDDSIPVRLRLKKDFFDSEIEELYKAWIFWRKYMLMKLWFQKF